MKELCDIDTTCLFHDVPKICSECMEYDKGYETRFYYNYLTINDAQLLIEHRDIGSEYYDSHKRLIELLSRINFDILPKTTKIGEN